MPKVPYTKPALNYADQLQRLRSRGLIIENDKKTLHLLQNISYYRISGYWYPMLEAPKRLSSFMGMDRQFACSIKAKPL